MSDRDKAIQEVRDEMLRASKGTIFGDPMTDEEVVDTFGRELKQRERAIRAERERDDLYQKIDRMIEANEWLLQDKNKTIAEKDARIAELQEFWDTALSQSVGIRYNYETKTIVNERAEELQEKLDNRSAFPVL